MILGYNVLGNGLLFQTGEAEWKKGSIDPWSFKNFFFSGPLVHSIWPIMLAFVFMAVLTIVNRG